MGTCMGKRKPRTARPASETSARNHPVKKHEPDSRRSHNKHPPSSARSKPEAVPAESSCGLGVISEDGDREINIIGGEKISIIDEGRREDGDRDVVEPSVEVDRDIKEPSVVNQDHRPEDDGVSDVNEIVVDIDQSPPDLDNSLSVKATSPPEELNFEFDLTLESDDKLCRNANSLKNRISSEDGDGEDDDDDDVAAAPKSKKEKSLKKPKGRRDRKRRPSEDETGDGAPKKRKAAKKKAGKETRLPPNYFVSVRLTSSEIHEGLSSVQEQLLEACPAVRSALVSLPTIHITIVVCRLDGENQIAEAVAALKEAREEIAKTPSFSSNKIRDPVEDGAGDGEPSLPIPKPSLHRDTVDGGSDSIELVSGRKEVDVDASSVAFPSFTLRGLGTFNGAVLYASVDEGIELLRGIFDVVAAVFRRRQICVTDDRDFKAHATVAKMSKAQNLRKKGIKRFEPAWYAASAHQFFGLQKIEGLQLCAMTGPKDELSQFYRVRSFEPFLEERLRVLPGRDFVLRDPKKNLLPES